MVKQTTPLEYLKLFRLQTAATTALAPIIGYLVLAAQVGYKILVTEIVILFVIGILMHIFEFVLNEYIDVEVDRLSLDLSKKPLVSGSVSLKASITLVFGAIIFAYILAIMFFFDLWSLIFLTLAFEFGAMYDIHGKRFAGSDFMLALWIFFFCLFGASIISIHFTGILFLVAGLGFFQILFNNAIEGGLKDADHDAVAGANTLAHVLGVKVKNNILTITKTFQIASYVIKICHILLIVILIYLGILIIDTIWHYLHFIIIIILIIIIFSTLQIFLTLNEFRRDRLKRIFSVHEIATFYLATIILLQLIGIIAVLFLLIFPLIWYMILNLALYGKPLEPRV